MIELQPDLRAMAPAGLFLVFRLRIAYPAAEFNHLPEDWVHHYKRNVFVIDDPLIRWAHFHRGVTRWSEVEEPDPRGMIEEAKSFGMPHGAVASVRCPMTGLKSYALAARADRAYKDDELEFIEASLLELHHDVDLTAAEIDALRMIQDGRTTKFIGAELGVSESAVKQRLRNARKKIGGKTSAHAAQLAAEAHII